jgi:hypothetical protein
MFRLIKRRPTGIVAAIVVLAVLLGAVVAVPVLLPHLATRASTESTAAHSGPRFAAARTPQAASTASVLLAVQDLTPSSHLSVTASGFLGREQLAVTIEDPQGQPYEQVTLIAGNDGSLRATPLALPPALASGSYRVVIVGSASHRTASAAFRMHDTPPTVALDTYTSAPGGMVGFAGSGFIPGEVVTVSLGASGAPLASMRATGEGAVTGRVKIPALAPGTYSLTLVGSVSQTPVSVGFNIQGFAPWVVLNHYAVTPGQGVGFIGQGFAPSEPVLVYLNSPRGTPALQVIADPSGRIVVQDSWVPSGVTGPNELTFVGQWSHATTTAQFTVLPGATPAPTPASP